jgi:MFS family permease
MPYRWVILFFSMLAFSASTLARNYITGVAKFVAEDLHIDKGDIGLMASAFFYAYALAQMPWGIASDRWGSRKTVSIGTFLTAVAILGFSTSTSMVQLVLWRVAMGAAAASVFVALAAGLARWFPPRERGMSQAVYCGAGGGLGDGMAFLFAPVILHFSVTSSWRVASMILAGLVFAVAVFSAIFLRSAPPEREFETGEPWTLAMLVDPHLWCFTFLYAGSMIAQRVVPTWLPIYVADVFIAKNHMSIESAAAAGGLIGLFYVVGRSLGTPVVGKLSDVLIRHGISRHTISIASLIITIVFLAVLSGGTTQRAALCGLAFCLGISINLWTLVIAAVSEHYPDRATASVMGFINMFGQFCGATALLASGYLGVSLNSQPGNAIEEYRGIWLVGIAACALTALLGMVLHSFAVRKQTVALSAETHELKRSEMSA